MFFFNLDENDHYDNTKYWRLNTVLNKKQSYKNNQQSELFCDLLKVAYLKLYKVR